MDKPGQGREHVTVVVTSPGAYPSDPYMQPTAGQYDLNTPAGQYLSGLDVAMRHGFIRKVFAIVFVQLLVTFGIILAFTYSDDVVLWARQNVGLYYVSFAVFIVLLIAISCNSKLARKHPWGMICLALLTLAMSFMLGFMAARLDKLVVVSALGGAVLITLVLTAFAMQTKYDFTSKAPYMLVVLVVFIMFGFGLWFFQESSTVRIVYAALGILIFSFFLVYDVQLIVGGSHQKYMLSVDEYVFAALNVYLDVVNIVMLLFIGGDAAS